MALQSTLRVLSNFGDGDSVVGEIHTRAREISRRRARS